MSRILKITLTTFFAAAGFLVFTNNSYAACRLSNPGWLPSVAGIGQQVTMTVQTADCSNIAVEFEIYEDDFFLSGNDFITKVFPVFTSNTVRTGTYAFSAADYNKGLNGGDFNGQQLTMFFTARALDSSGNEISRVKSSYLYLNPPSDGTGGGPGGGTGGGPCTGTGGEPIPCPGETVSVSFEIPNPIAAESLIDLAKAIGKFLFQIAIPIAVIVIIYAGLLFLTSRGDKEKVKTARTALWYAVIGLAVILIGQGFFTLIKSILELGGPTP